MAESDSRISVFHLDNSKHFSRWKNLNQSSQLPYLCRPFPVSKSSYRILLSVSRARLRPRFRTRLFVRNTKRLSSSSRPSRIRNGWWQTSITGVIRPCNYFNHQDLAADRLNHMQKNLANSGLSSSVCTAILIYCRGILVLFCQVEFVLDYLVMARPTTLRVARWRENSSWRESPSGQ